MNDGINISMTIKRFSESYQATRFSLFTILANAISFKPVSLPIATARRMRSVTPKLLLVVKVRARIQCSGTGMKIYDLPYTFAWYKLYVC